MNKQSLILVMGANGRLGGSLVNAFSAAGWQVRAQVRDQTRWCTLWPDSVEPWYCDAHDRDALCRAAEGAKVVVNALNPLYSQWEKHALSLGENALAVARSSGALLLFPGNIYNYGNRLPKILNEDTPQVGNTSKAHIRIEMEKNLRVAANDGVNSVILRSGDYFGETVRGSWFDLVIAKKLREGKITYPGPTDRIHAWSYLPDLAECFVRIASLYESIRGFHTYNFPGFAFSGDELHKELEKVMGQPLLLKRMNWWGFRMAAPFSPMARALLDMRYLWYRHHRLEDNLLGNLIGALPSTSLHDALRKTLQGLEMVPVKKELHHV